jgi:Ca2+-binding RTX toxin-like protein
MSTLTLTGNHGFVAERLSGLAAGTIIDATSATFIQDNWTGDGGGSNAYPFQVVQTANALIIGGSIIGQVDQTADWRTVYSHGNSAGVRIEDAPNAIIRDWRITNTWDAVRVSWNSQNFLIDSVWVTNARDDAVENDRLLSGTIKDSLFDGVFGGMSIDPSSSSPVDGHNETVTMNGVLMRLQLSLYEGEMTHASFIKTDSATPGTVTPHLRFINNVIAIEDVTHHSYRSLLDAWAHTVESSGNYYLNLSDTPLPADYPMPPAGWTVLQGQAARDYWQAARTDWIDRHTDGGPVTFTGAVYVGDGTAETISGNALDNVIFGNGGNDTIDGGSAGNDALVGGLGNDTVSGGVGDDILLMDDFTAAAASSGADTGNGDAGNDLLWGYGGNDALFGGDGNDALVGNDLGTAAAGSDQLFGGNGNDVMFTGLAGTAVMDGGAGNDLFYGGAGADSLRGGLGSDYLVGGAGADLFKFYKADIAANDLDTVFFVNAGDKLQFSAAMLNTLYFQDLTNLRYDGDPTHLTTGVYITEFLAGGQTAHITVYGTTVAQLTPMVEYTL